MTKEEFIQCCIRYVQKNQGYIPWKIASQYCEPVSKAFLRAEHTGGLTGGNCWNDNEPYPYENDVADPGIGVVLDPFLAQYFPEIPFLVYRKLTALVVDDSFTEYEYYGNRTDYGVWALRFDDAWSVLEPFAADIVVEVSGVRNTGGGAARKR